MAQLAFKLRQNNSHCTPLSSHSENHPDRARTLQNALVSKGVINCSIPAVSRSVCPLPTILSKSECHPSRSAN